MSLKIISDEYKFPFSVFSELKTKNGNLKIAGDVIEQMDQTIGRLTFKIKGVVSANNYIEIDNLNLTGNHLCFQYCLIKPQVATFHLDIMTNSSHLVRLSFSTLYDKEEPKFLGRSLRLPLPLVSGWTNLVLDLTAIIGKFCNVDKAPRQIFNSIKKIKICSNVIIRDIITSKTLFTPEFIKDQVKDLTAKPNSSLHFIDLIEYLEKMKIIDCPASNLISSVIFYETKKKEIIPITKPNDVNSLSPTSDVLPLNNATNALEESNQISTPLSIPETPLAALRQEDLEIESNNKSNHSNPNFSIDSNPRLIPNENTSLPPENVVVQTPLPAKVFSGSLPPVFGTTIMKQDKTLNYRGGPAALIYSNRLLIYSSNSQITMLDLEKNPLNVPKTGLWKAFKMNSKIQDGNSFYRQSFLKGHNNNVKFLEVSENQTLMATSEEAGNGLIILWDLLEGSRVASLKPYKGGICSVTFNFSSTMLATVGYDTLNRCQIIIWDISLLKSQKGAVQTNDQSNSCIIARQISEFSIEKIRFLPFDENSLISCGRENIRLWRIKNGHLPGRPILLKEYTRGYIYTDISFQLANQKNSDVSLPFIFVSSSKGLVIKLNYEKELVVCAYQLHSSQINCFQIKNGYAVSGADDNKLRIWPLDFSDFLLEARHEGNIKNIFVSSDGKMLIVGTSAGTLGLLNVSDHSYETILRSHTDKILKIEAATSANEISTISLDRTIRVWNVETGLQSVEFLSDLDNPTCVVYYSDYNKIICGFSSGMIRIFQIQSANSERDIHIHSSSIIQLICFQCSQNTYLISIDDAGNILLNDLDNNLFPFSKSVINGISSTITCRINAEASLLAVGKDQNKEIILYKLNDLIPVLTLNLSNIFSPEILSPLSKDSAMKPSDSESPFNSTRVSNKSSPIHSLSDLSKAACIISFEFFSQIENSFLIFTDKNVYFLKFDIPELENNKVTPNKSRGDKRDLIIVKRNIDFGIPSLIKFDTRSQLFFVVVKNALGSKKSSNLDSESESFIILNIEVRQNSDNFKILFSTHQNIPTSLGTISDIAITPNYFICGDINGGISIWNFSLESLRKLKSEKLLSFSSSKDKSIELSSAIKVPYCPVDSNINSYQEAINTVDSVAVTLLGEFQKSSELIDHTTEPTLLNVEELNDNKQIENKSTYDDLFWEEENSGPGDILETPEEPKKETKYASKKVIQSIANKTKISVLSKLKFQSFNTIDEKLFYDFFGKFIHEESDNRDIVPNKSVVLFQAFDIALYKNGMIFSLFENSIYKFNLYQNFSYFVPFASLSTLNFRSLFVSEFENHLGCVGLINNSFRVILWEISDIQIQEVQVIDIPFNRIVSNISAKFISASEIIVLITESEDSKNSLKLSQFIINIYDSNCNMSFKPIKCDGTKLISTFFVKRTSVITSIITTDVLCQISQCYLAKELPNKTLWVNKPSYQDQFLCSSFISSSMSSKLLVTISKMGNISIHIFDFEKYFTAKSSFSQIRIEGLSVENNLVDLTLLSNEILILSLNKTAKIFSLNIKNIGNNSIKHTLKLLNQVYCPFQIKFSFSLFQQFSNIIPIIFIGQYGDIGMVENLHSNSLIHVQNSFGPVIQSNTHIFISTIQARNELFLMINLKRKIIFYSVYKSSKSCELTFSKPLYCTYSHFISQLDILVVSCSDGSIYLYDCSEFLFQKKPKELALEVPNNCSYQFQSLSNLGDEIFSMSSTQYLENFTVRMLSKAGGLNTLHFTICKSNIENSILHHDDSPENIPKTPFFSKNHHSECIGDWFISNGNKLVYVSTDFASISQLQTNIFELNMEIKSTDSYFSYSHCSLFNFKSGHVISTPECNHSLSAICLNNENRFCLLQSEILMSEITLNNIVSFSKTLELDDIPQSYIFCEKFLILLFEDKLCLYSLINLLKSTKDEVLYSPKTLYSSDFGLIHLSPFKNGQIFSTLLLAQSSTLNITIVSQKYDWTLNFNIFMDADWVATIDS